MISFRSHGPLPREGLKAALFVLQDYGKIMGLSSLFRIFEDVRSLSAVVKVDLQRPIEELSTYFSEIEGLHKVSGEILLIEDMVQMRPDMTIPHPDLHRLAHWLVPASELWPSAVHPILKRNLSDLATELPEKPWGEFIAQGKTLLDFSDYQS